MSLTPHEMILGVALISLLAGLETLVGWAIGSPPTPSGGPGPDHGGSRPDAPLPTPPICSTPRVLKRQTARSRVS
jgi:hypothetical protein